MKPTEILMGEHRVIEQVIGCVEKMAAIADATSRLNTEHAAQAIEFIRHFADHCHHAKEEDQLFKLLYEKGFSSEQGPVAVMLDEHETGRYHVRGMAEAVEAFTGGDKCAAQSFASHARAYAQLLRSHIIKEDFILYPMADEALEEADQQRLLDEFEVVEQGHSDHHEKFLAVADELGQFYSVPRPLEPNYAGLESVCPAHATLPCSE